jgi:hypothetical protein
MEDLQFHHGRHDSHHNTHSLAIDVSKFLAQTEEYKLLALETML